MQSKMDILNAKIKKLREENPNAVIYIPRLADPTIRKVDPGNFPELQYFEELCRFTIADFQRLYEASWVHTPIAYEIRQTGVHESHWMDYIDEG